MEIIITDIVLNLPSISICMSIVYEPMKIMDTMIHVEHQHNFTITLYTNECERYNKWTGINVDTNCIIMEW